MPKGKFQLELSPATGVIVNVLLWGTTERADGIGRDVTGLAFLGFDGFYSFAIAQTIGFIPELPVLFEKGFDDGKLIRKEFLILWAVKVVMCALLERNVSTKKENEPLYLLVLFLNDSEEIEYNVSHSNDSSFR